METLRNCGTEFVLSIFKEFQSATLNTFVYTLYSPCISEKISQKKLVKCYFVHHKSSIINQLIKSDFSLNIY
jgi:hypothetical protein